MRNSFSFFTLFLLFFTLSGCASVPETRSYADIVASHEALKTESRRISLDIEADCDGEYCTVPESTLDRITSIITLLQDEIDARAAAHNHVVGALSHCEYSNELQSNARQLTEQALQRESITSTVKQAVLMLGCGAGLLLR